MKGTIKKLIGDRGFGFIVTEEGDEIFFHRSGLKEVEFETLKEGAAVEFDKEQGTKGPRAANITLSA
jgi:CspA family cold shock protein|tara:strand:- start:60 stop:260 length:201 start_codon:yes stop_codon:yes gene_type:complete